MSLQLESVVTFLSQVPDPEGKPALNFVMKEWCARHVRLHCLLLPPSCFSLSPSRLRTFFQPFFFGVYETRVSTLALCRVLTHCVTTGDERLTKITVKVEDLSSSAQQFGERQCSMPYGHAHTFINACDDMYWERCGHSATQE